MPSPQPRIRSRKPPAAHPSRWAPFWAVLPPLFQSVVLAAVGFALTGQVELALKDRAATVAGIQAMTGHIEAIVTASNDDGARRTQARRLALYGVDAIAPLVVMGLAASLPMDSAVEGLSLIAVRHKKEVCVAVRSALDTDVEPAASADEMKLLRVMPDSLRCRWWWRNLWVSS